MKALNGRVDKTNERLDTLRHELKSEIDKTNERLDGLRHELWNEFDALGRRVVESEVRLATATTRLSGDVQELSGLIGSGAKSTAPSVQT